MRSQAEQHWRPTNLWALGLLDLARLADAAGNLAELGSRLQAPGPAENNNYYAFYKEVRAVI